MKTTPIAKYSYPEDADPPDGPGQLSTLARQFDTTTIPKFTSTADRDAAFPTPGDNQMCYLTSSDIFMVYSASARAWQEFFFSQPPKVTWSPLAPYYAKNVADYGGTWSPVEFGQDVNGEMHFRGLARAGAALPAGSALTTAIPAGMRPGAYMGWEVERSTHYYTRLTISAAGVFTTTEALSSGQFVFFDSVHYFPA